LISGLCSSSCSDPAATALNIGDFNPKGLRYAVNPGLQELHIPVIDKDRSPVLDALHQMVVQGIDRMSTFVESVLNVEQG
jgi:hypothetical protein